jgi:two-component system, NarL family, sensor histidine kinase DegS
MRIATARRFILPLFRRRDKTVLNPHFWILFFMILALSYMYYANLSMLDHYYARWGWVWNLVVFEFNYGLNGSLFCIPLFYAGIIFGWQGAVLAWIATMALMLPRINYLTYNSTSFITNIFCLLIPLLIILIVAIQRNWRESINNSTLDREKERQAYIAQILKAQEDERKRISREIHDDTTQRLWIVSNQIQSLITHDSETLSPQTAAELGKVKEQIVQISHDAKRLSVALRPGILDNLGLIPALRYLVDQLNKEGKTTVNILIEGVPKSLPNEVNTHLYRITQEALNNVRRHSQATQASVSLFFETKTIRLEVWDNGKGLLLDDINKLSIENKFGITGIQERARLLGGELKIGNPAGGGTTLSLGFPG